MRSRMQFNKDQSDYIVTQYREGAKLHDIAAGLRTLGIDSVCTATISRYALDAGCTGRQNRKVKGPRKTIQVNTATEGYLTNVVNTVRELVEANLTPKVKGELMRAYLRSVA